MHRVNVRDQPGTTVAHVTESALARAHPVVEFDNKCFLHETGRVTLPDGTEFDADHTYVVNGALGYESATTVIGAFAEPFDAPSISRKKVVSPYWSRDPAYSLVTSTADAMFERTWTEQWAHRVPASLQSTFDEVGAGTRSLTSAMAILDAATGTDPVVTAFSRQLRDALTDMTAECLRATWRNASTLGTAMHELIELYFDSHAATLYEFMCRRTNIIDRAPKEPELGQFIRWHDEWLLPRGYEPFRTELRVFDSTLMICGSIDALFRHRTTGDLIMVDWKRSKGIAWPGYTRARRTSPDEDGCLFEWRSAPVPRWTKNMFSPFTDLVSCNYNKYWLQQLLYKHMIERNTSLRVTAMYLLVCHPNQGRDYDLIPLAANTDLTDRLHSARVQVLHAKNRASAT